MIYRKQTRYERGRKILFWSSLAFLAVVAVSFGAPSFLPSIFTATGLPFWSAGNNFSDNFSLDLSLASRSELIARIENLNRALSEEELRTAVIGVLSKENEELKNLLGRSDSGKKKIIAAVIGRPPSTLYDTFILDVGRSAGILKGDLVLASEYYPIGEITEVFSDYSKAILFSSPGKEIKVLLGDENTEMTGRGMGGYYIVEVPQEFLVLKGDSVILPDINLQIYGFVESVELRPASPFKYVYFGSPININNIRFVTIHQKEKVEEIISE